MDRPGATKAIPQTRKEQRRGERKLRTTILARVSFEVLHFPPHFCPLPNFALFIFVSISKTLCGLAAPSPIAHNPPHPTAPRHDRIGNPLLRYFNEKKATHPIVHDVFRPYDICRRYSSRTKNFRGPDFFNDYTKPAPYQLPQYRHIPIHIKRHTIRCYYYPYGSFCYSDQFLGAGDCLRSSFTTPIETSRITNRSTAMVSRVLEPSPPPPPRRC